MNEDEKIREEYESILNAAKRFCSELTHQITELINQNDITLGFPIESRVKTLDSIIKKIERKSFSIKSIKELTDLIGLRIILLFKKDVKRVCDILSENFKVLEKEDKLEAIPESQFGYTSIHYVLKLPDEWLKVPTLKSFKGLSTEIQIRTVAQHIWATASHKLQYKDESSVPLSVRRSIHRVSALLETVDLEFERILDEKREYKEEIGKEIPLADNEPLNVDLLEKMLDDLLPAQNKEPGREPYSELIKDLAGNGISTVKQLKSLITDNINGIMNEEKKNVEEMELSFNPARTTKERNDRRVFYTHVGLARAGISKGIGRKWYEYKEKTNPNQSLN